MKKDEPEIRDLAETLVRAERQNDTAAAKELLAEDVIVGTPQPEARGKEAAVARLREAIRRMPTAGAASDRPLQFEELEAIGDWAYFRLRFAGGAWPKHLYLRSIAHKERDGRWRVKRISLARAA